MRRLIGVVVVAVMFLVAAEARGVEWVRGGDDGTQPVWGVAGGLQFAIPPASQGPRGLIRVLYPTLPGGRYDLINFIAVEPIVRGKRGFSELERSEVDGVSGKRMWVETRNAKTSKRENAKNGESEGKKEEGRREEAERAAEASTPTSLRLDGRGTQGALGEVWRGEDGIERLRVVIRVETYENGAHVRLVVEQRSDCPDEMAIAVQPEPDSAPMEYCILTATMGNRARTRRLWLKDEVVSSQELYPEYRGPDFAPHTIYPRERLAVTREGDLVASVTTDEENPAQVRPFPGTDSWYYGGFPVRQYWKKRKETWRDDVHVAVNARYTYWLSRQPIPGGIAFENFELRERFFPEQEFVFGVTVPADGRQPATDHAEPRSMEGSGENPAASGTPTSLRLDGYGTQAEADDQWESRSYGWAGGDGRGCVVIGGCRWRVGSSEALVTAGMSPGGNRPRRGGRNRGVGAVS